MREIRILRLMTGKFLEKPTIGEYSFVSPNNMIIRQM